MAHELLSNCPNISNRLYMEPPYRNAGKKQYMNWVGMSNDHQYRRRRRRRKNAGHCSTVKTRVLERKSRGFCTSSSLLSSSSTEEVRLVDEDIDSKGVSEEYVVIGKQEGWNWNVRRMAENEDEMRKVAQIQAEAFHVPVALFNDFFFQFFQAEVLAGLLYRLRNSPPDRYACLVAETSSETDSESPKEIVGVADITVLRDDAILQHLRGSQEYLYVSGIAVLNSFRRRKVATALLKACDVLSITWGFEYLVLRAYEDDLGARKLYTNAGYNVVSGDPPWMTTWIGRKRRILLIKWRGRDADRAHPYE